MWLQRVDWPTDVLADEAWGPLSLVGELWWYTTLQHDPGDWLRL